MSPETNEYSRPLPPTSAISDVLGLWGLDGALSPPLIPLSRPSETMMAQVVTVSFEIAPTGPGMVPLFELLSNDQSNRALLLSGLDGLPGAAFGEILATAARERCAAAVLVDGAVRDVGALDDVGLPVYGRRRVIAGPDGRAHVRAIGGTVTLDGVSIESGDAVVLDGEGCVRLPRQMSRQVIDAAARYAAAEDQLLAALQAGARINEAYAIKKAVVEQLAQR